MVGRLAPICFLPGATNSEVDERLFLEAFPIFLLMLANKTHAGQAIGTGARINGEVVLIQEYRWLIHLDW